MLVDAKRKHYFRVLRFDKIKIRKRCDKNFVYFRNIMNNDNNDDDIIG